MNDIFPVVIVIVWLFAIYLKLDNIHNTLKEKRKP